MRYLNQKLLLTLAVILLCMQSINASVASTYKNEQIKIVANLYHQSDSLIDIGKFDTACFISNQNLQSVINEYGSSSIEYSFALYKHAYYQFEYGMMQSCDTLINKSQQINNAIDSTNLLAARILYLQCEVGNSFGKQPEQIPRAKRMLTLFERHLGKNDVEYAHGLEVLGNILPSESKFDEAFNALSEAIEILENKFDSNSVELWRSYNYMGSYWVKIFEVEKAKHFLDKSIQVLTNHYGENYWKLGIPLERRSIQLYYDSKLYQALEVINASIELKMKQLPEEHPEIIVSNYLLGLYTILIGKYEVAEPILKNNKLVTAKVYGKKSAVMVNPLLLLSSLMSSQGRHESAKELLEECLLLDGVDNSMRTAVKNNLADVYIHLKEYEKAKTLLDEVIAFRIKQFHAKHTRVAHSLKLLGDIYSNTNEFFKAESLYLDVKNIYEHAESYGVNSEKFMDINFKLAKLYLRNDQFTKAEKKSQIAYRISKKLLRKTNPALIKSQLQLALIQGNLGNFESSLKYTLEGLQARKEFITNIFQFASEKQKLLYTDIHSLFFDPLISFTLQSKTAPLENASINMILQGKALVVDAMTENKSVLTCEDNIEFVVLFNHHSLLCSEIADLALSSRFGEKSSHLRIKLDSLFELRDSLESVMSSACVDVDSDENNNITFHDVSKVLLKNEILIDYMKFQSLDDDSVYNYCGYTLNSSGEKQFLYIGSTLLIDSLIKAFNNEIRNSQSLIYSQAASYAESRLKKITSQLHRLLIAPFEKDIVSQNKLFISPDASLNLFPFELLTDSTGNYLIESYEISYVSSGRDLLKFNKSAEKTNGVVIVANPDFEFDFEKIKIPHSNKLFSDIEFSVTQSQRDRVACIGNNFSPLTYSINESKSILTILNKYNKKFSVQEFYRENASVTNLRNLAKPPQVLHLSTHGFFCNDTSGNSISHPLLRSGLVLAGANRSHDNRAIDDGILTALEVTGLNLMGTELVTLSACETGMGEAVSGEGVFGLRRAFQIAGAKSILMSMWKIPDKETSDLMTKFYDKLFSGKSKQQSLRESALEILEDSRATLNHGHPYLWGGFILTGNPN